MTIQNAPKKAINEGGSGYTTQPQQEYYDQGMMNTNTVMEPIYYTTNQTVPKNEKKADTFVFNFNKGSAPVFNINKEN